MRGSPFRRTLASAAVVAALGITEGPAYGAVFAGTFDPVDFSGSFTLVLADACLLSDGWKANGAGGCSGTLTFAQADVTSSPPEGPSFVGQLTFAPPPISDPLTILGFHIVGGLLMGFDSTLIHHTGASPSTPDDWWIQFTSGAMPGGNHGPDPVGCEPYCFEPPIGDLDLLFGIQQEPGLSRGVYLYAANGLTGGQPVLVDTAQYTSIQLIPEPGTLALAVGAMLTGWVIRRRVTRDTPS